MRTALLLWLSSLFYTEILSPQPSQTATATISGVVLDASGKPYAGAQVWTMEVGPHPFRHGETSYPTDAQGRFRLDVVPGSYFVCAFPPGVGRDETKMALPACFPSAPKYSTATAVTVEPHGASPQLTICLLEVPTYRISGRLTPNLVPQTEHWGMTIDAESDQPHQHLGCGRIQLPYSSACATGYFGDVKANGTFAISGVPAGSYTLYGKAGDYVGQEEIATDILGHPPLPSTPPTYTGERNVVVKGNLRRVRVKLEVHNQAP